MHTLFKKTALVGLLVLGFFLVMFIFLRSQQAVVVTQIISSTSTKSIASCVAASTARVKSYCWADIFTTTVRDKGLPAAFDLFAQMYATDPVFEQNCHDIMHILGKAGYDEFKKDGVPVLRPETSYCGYGFYHGFIEEMLVQSGTLQLQDGARYCQAIRTSSAFPSERAALTATQACFHGLGHATLDSLDSLWGDDAGMVALAITRCEGASPQEFQAQCASGVFNSLAIAYSAHSYGLTFRDRDPTSICRLQKANYQRPCYEEVSVGYIREKRYDFNAAIKFIQTLVSHQGDVIYGYIDDYIRHDLMAPGPADVMPLCNGLPTPDQTENCVHAVVHAFIATGEPGKDEVKAIPYCQLFPEKDSLRTLCFKDIGNELKNIKSYERVREICATLSADDAAACDRTPIQTP